MEASTLSSRADAQCQTYSNIVWEVLKDLWHPQDNSKGIVNLGVAENTLMHAELQDFVRRNTSIHQHAFTYGDGNFGSKRLRGAVAQFLNERLRPVLPLEAEHIVVTNGVSHAIEHCSWALCNKGDGILLGRPYYKSFIADISLRPEVKVVTVSFGGLDPLGTDCVKRYEEAVLSARQRGVVVRGLILCNPHNPLGRCYPKETIKELMKLCQRHRMHFISDEIYALSTWENKGETWDSPPVPFVSTLAVPTDGLIDPERVHVLWGMSKDFGANGLRVGYLISQHNRNLHTALQSVALYSYVSSISDHLAAAILENVDWVDRYIESNRQKLSESFSFAVRFLRKQGISYTPGAYAAFFLWVDLGRAYCERHPEASTSRDLNTKISRRLIEEKVFIANGTIFGSEKEGLFRVVFSHPIGYLEEGLKRMMKAINNHACVQ
ncbi:pyridoxal phosphate-dependent transferase [Aspergillus minisclerotigenes]|uniref:Pyridoxal phosphate-dependent transferase n=1 Tax=Aspergillus minisclerotigenes TaxID=656917 RepID=A0A5N6J5C0_9EURO|nr:pyridoxal phosphate-dependent transferase [Aspergillus minisclerotigenes]